MAGRRVELELEGGEVLASHTILGAYEAAAMAAARRARDDTVAVARRNFPGHRTDAAIRGTASRTATGVAVTVGPSRGRASYIVRFVELGTGVHGPRGRVIPRSRRGRLPSGAVPSGRGQRAQHPIARTRDAMAVRVQRALEDAAGDAARRLGL